MSGRNAGGGGAVAKIPVIRSKGGSTQVRCIIEMRRSSGYSSSEIRQTTGGQTGDHYGVAIRCITTVGTIHRQTNPVTAIGGISMRWVLHRCRNCHRRNSRNRWGNTCAGAVKMHCSAINGKRIISRAGQELPAVNDCRGVIRIRIPVLIAFHLYWFSSNKKFDACFLANLWVLRVMIINGWVDSAIYCNINVMKDAEIKKAAIACSLLIILFRWKLFCCSAVGFTTAAFQGVEVEHQRKTKGVIQRILTIGCWNQIREVKAEYVITKS